MDMHNTFEHSGAEIVVDIELARLIPTVGKAQVEVGPDGLLQPVPVAWTTYSRRLAETRRLGVASRLAQRVEEARLAARLLDLDRNVR